MARTIDNLFIELDAIDNTEDEFNSVKDSIREIDRLQRQVNSFEENQQKRNRQAASERNKENLEHIKNQDREKNRASLEERARISKQASDNRNASKERIQYSKTEQQEKTRAHQSEMTNIRREQNAENNASRQAIANTRAVQSAESNRSREAITNTNAEISQKRILGQEDSRRVQRQRLAEQRLAREQRERFGAIRRAQLPITRGFQSWLTSAQGLSILFGTSLIEGVRRFGAAILEATREFEAMRLGLGAIEGSQRLADRQIREIRQAALLPGVGFETGLLSLTQLRSSGFSFDQGERLITEVGNLAALTGRTQDDIGRALYQFQQIAGLGEFRQEELRQILEIIPTLRQTLERVFGSFQGDEIQQAIERAGLTFSQAFEKILVELESGPRASTELLANQLENLNDNFRDMLRGFGQDFQEDMKNIVKALNAIVVWVTENRDLVKTIVRIGLGGLGAAAAHRLAQRAGKRAALQTGATGGAAGAAGAHYLLGERFTRGARRSQFLTEVFPSDIKDLSTKSSFFEGDLRQLRAFQNMDPSDQLEFLRGRMGLVEPGGMFSDIPVEIPDTKISEPFTLLDANKIIEQMDGGRGKVRLRDLAYRGGKAVPAAGGAIAGAFGPEIILWALDLMAPVDTEPHSTLTDTEPTETEKKVTQIVEGAKTRLGKAVEQMLIIQEFLDQWTKMQSDFLEKGSTAINRKSLNELAGPGGRIDDEIKTFRDMVDKYLKANADKFYELDREISWIWSNPTGEQLDERGNLTKSAEQRIKALEKQAKEVAESTRLLRGLQAALNYAIRDAVDPQLDPAKFYMDLGILPLDIRGTYGPHPFKLHELWGREGIPRPNYNISPPSREPRPSEQDRRAEERARREMQSRVGASGTRITITITGSDPRTRDLMSGMEKMFDPRGEFMEEAPMLGQNRAQLPPDAFAFQRRERYKLQQDIEKAFDGMDQRLTEAEKMFDQGGTLRTMVEGSSDTLGRRLSRTEKMFGDTGELLKMVGETQQFTSDLTIPERGLLEARNLEVVTKEVRDLTAAWYDMRTEVHEFAESFDADKPFSVVFSKSRLDLARNTIKEYKEIQSQLFRLAAELDTLEDVPVRVTNNLSNAAKQLRDQIDRLNKVLDRFKERSEKTKEVYNDVLRIQEAMGSIGPRVAPGGDWGPDAISPIPEEITPSTDLARAIERHISRSGESLYDQFIAPSILDAIPGIESGRTAARNRALEELKKSIEEARRETRNNDVLNEREKNVELLEINREYQEEKREIERQYEEERSDAWKDWVRTQLTDIPKLIFEQLKLQLAARATNEILRSLGLGSRVPITGPASGGGGAGSGGGGGLFGWIKNLFGGGGGGAGGGGAGAAQYSAPIGPGLSGGETVVGAGAGGTAATAGVAVSAALAAHNIATGIVPQWNPHGQSLFDDFGKDIISPITDPAKTFFDNLHFNNPVNDEYARHLGRQRSQNMIKGLAKESARDLASEYDKGRAQGQNQNMDDYVMFHKDAKIDVNLSLEMFEDKIVRKISFRADELKSEGRL